MPTVADVRLRPHRRARPAAAHLEGDRLVVDDEARFRVDGRRDLAWTAAFSTDEATIAAARWIVWEASQALGARSASIQELYMARGRGRGPRVHRPAINIRAQTFDMARTVSRPPRAATSARSSSSWPAASRPTRSSGRSTTRPRVLAGAIAAGWRGPGVHPGRPLPVQRQEVRRRPRGDDRGDPAGMPVAIDAGYRNIDIDCSTLVDLSKPTVDEQQRENYVRAAELTALIRSSSPTA